MTELIELRNDGPHSPEYTAKVADLLAECARTLNYATMAGSGGLEYPGDVYTLLGHLYTATQRLPQLCDQLAVFLKAQAASGRLGHQSGMPPGAAAELAVLRLEVARARAHDLTSVLQQVQNAISGLYVKENPDAG